MIICLRTVCGCERLLDIPHTTLPYQWRVPYVRRPNFALAGDAARSMSGHAVRVFQYTPVKHNRYGYPVFLEEGPK